MDLRCSPAGALQNCNVAFVQVWTGLSAAIHGFRSGKIPSPGAARFRQNQTNAQPAAGLLITTIATVVCRVAFACSAVRSEITGKTVQYHGGRGGFGFTRPVTRQDSPETFRSCTNWRGALSIGFIGFSIVSFRFYRRLESEDLLS